MKILVFWILLLIFSWFYFWSTHQSIEPSSEVYFLNSLDMYRVELWWISQINPDFSKINEFGNPLEENNSEYNFTLNKSQVKPILDQIDWNNAQQLNIDSFVWSKVSKSDSTFSFYLDSSLGWSLWYMREKRVNKLFWLLWSELNWNYLSEKFVDTKQDMLKILDLYLEWNTEEIERFFKK